MRQDKVEYSLETCMFPLFRLFLFLYWIFILLLYSSLTLLSESRQEDKKDTVSSTALQSFWKEGVKKYSVSGQRKYLSVFFFISP